MRRLNRAARLAAQISLLVALLSTQRVPADRVYLGDEEQVWNQGNVTEVVGTAAR